MAYSINFDDGYKEFEINGDPNRVLRFNPADIGVVDRMHKAVENMQNDIKNIGDVKITQTGDAMTDVKEVADIVRRINESLRSGFDEIFYPGASRIVFGVQNPMAIASGKTIYENFMNEYIKVVEPFIHEAQKESETVMKEYKEAYDRTAANIVQN